MKPIINDNILRDAVVKELESDLEVAAKHISAVRQLTGVRAVGNLIEVKSEAGPPPRGRRRQPITSIGRVGFTRPERSSS